MSYLSKYSPHSQQSTVEAELATLAADGFARLLADNGHAPEQRHAASTRGGGGLALSNVTSHNPHLECDTSNTEYQISYSKNEYPLTISDYSNVETDTWEAARQRNAIERGYAYVPSSKGELSSSVSVMQKTDTDCLRIDGELARMCGISFKQYALLQRWLALHDMSRAGGQGFTFDELYTRCVQLGVKGCETYTRRIIRKGIGFYWEYDPRTDRIYPASYLTLCKRAIQHAYDHGLHDLYLYGNHPGQRRDMYISVSGSGADFEGAILASWYGLHGNPTISRFTLSALLNRDARSIRRMEKRACIHITYNEAQTSDPAAVPLNADGSLRGDVTYTEGVWHFRMPNSYTPRMTRQHPYKGQGRKAVCWFKHWLEQPRLPGRPQAKVVESIHDLGKLNLVCRTYCETDRALNASRKRGRKDVLYLATLRRNKGLVWAVDAVNEDIYG